MTDTWVPSQAANRGRFREHAHLCDLPFRLDTRDTWMGRVWHCDWCHIEWEMIGLTRYPPGSALAGMTDITWAKIRPTLDVVNADKHRAAVALERESRRDMRDDS